MKKIILILAILSTSNINGFSTLSDFKVYAKNHYEFPEMDNSDILKPSYKSFHKNNLESWGDRRTRKFLEFFKLKHSTWTANIFKEKLESLIEKRSSKGIRGDFIKKIIPNKGDKFIIFGDLHGAYHSLIRSLEELKCLNIINNKLKIQDGYYLIFNGDVINRSPYILETFTVVLALMEANPQKIIYIKGDHEVREGWYKYGLNDELNIRARNVSEEEIPLRGLIKEFYFTLPLALYLKSSAEEALVRVSHYDMWKASLKEENFVNFLNSTNPGIQVFNLGLSFKGTKKPNIKAIIKSLETQSGYIRNRGLVYLPKDRNVNAWATFSSPTMTYRMKNEFFYDSFSILTPEGPIDNWEIELHSQDTRGMSGFRTAAYNLVSGKLIRGEGDDFASVRPIKIIVPIPKPESEAKSVSSREKEESIVLGCSLWSSEKGGLSPSIMKGLSLKIEQQNRDGGINGKNLKIIFLDDEYVPELARKNIEMFLNKYKVDIILSPNGTPTLKSYFDLVKQKKVLVLFPVTGSGAFRAPEDHIAHLRVSYPDEVRTIMKYIMQEREVSRIAVFYQDDAFGQESMKIAKEVMKQEGSTEILAVPYRRRTAVFSKEAKKISEFNPKAIFLISTDKVAAALIRQLGPHKIASKILFALSDMSINWFKNLVKEKGVNFVGIRLFPESDDIEIVREFKEQTRTTDEAIDPFVFEGYINASLMIDILKKVKGKITKEKIIEVINGIKDYNFKGLRLSLDPQTRELHKGLWIETETGELLQRGGATLNI